MHFFIQDKPQEEWKFKHYFFLLLLLISARTMKLQDWQAWDAGTTAPPLNRSVFTWLRNIPLRHRATTFRFTECDWLFPEVYAETRRCQKCGQPCLPERPWSLPPPPGGRWGRPAPGSDPLSASPPAANRAAQAWKQTFSQTYSHRSPQWFQ